MNTDYKLPYHAENILLQCYTVPKEVRKAFLDNIRSLSPEVQHQTLQDAMKDGGDDAIMAARLLGKVVSEFPGASNKVKNPIHTKT